MLVLLLKFLYVIALSFIWGSPCYKHPASFSVIAITGIAGINIIAGFLSLYLPMGSVVNGLLLGGACLLVMCNRQRLLADIRHYRQQVKITTLPVKLFFILAVLCMLYFSSQQSFTYDEGLYYAPFIKWTQTFAVVPGLANLHTRLGFNSQWHVMAALFNGSFLLHTALNPLNGVLYALLLLYLLKPATSTLLSNKFRMALLVIIHLPWLNVYDLVAPAADLVVYYLTCLLVLCWLEQLEQGTHNHRLLLWILPAYLVTIKLSAAPVLAVSGVYAWQLLRQRHYTSCWLLAGIHFIILAPWLIRNVVLTGYLVFPLESIDLFTVNWKVPAAQVHHTREVIRVYGYLRDKIAAHELHSRWEMLVYLCRHNIRIYDFIILALALLSPAIVWKYRARLPKGFGALYTCLLAGCLFWFIQAPDPRFGYGFLIPMALFSVILSLPALRMLQAMVLVGALQLTTAGLQIHLHHIFIRQGLIPQNTTEACWLKPPPNNTIPLRYQALPFPHYVPAQRDQCWDAPLPCTNDMSNDVIMRGPRLQDGFRPVQPIH